MAATVELIGLADLRDALRRLPQELTDEAGAIVVAHAKEAEHLVEAAYPLGPTGNLKRGVRTTVEGSRLGVQATVKSGAKHAFIFEKGTTLRTTKAGANRGRMPEASRAQQMIPIVIQVRRRMTAALIALVQKAGFVVTTT